MIPEVIASLFGALRGAADMESARQRTYAAQLHGEPSARRVAVALKAAFQWTDVRP